MYGAHISRIILIINFSRRLAVTNVTKPRQEPYGLWATISSIKIVFDSSFHFGFCLIESNVIFLNVYALEAIVLSDGFSLSLSLLKEFQKAN